MCIPLHYRWLAAAWFMVLLEKESSVLADGFSQNRKQCLCRCCRESKTCQPLIVFYVRPCLQLITHVHTQQSAHSEAAVSGLMVDIKLQGLVTLIHSEDLYTVTLMHYVNM